MIDEEGLQKNALDVGTYLLKGLDKLRDKYDVIGDVRGKVSYYSYISKYPLKMVGLVTNIDFVGRQSLNIPFRIYIVAI